MAIQITSFHISVVLLCYIKFKEERNVQNTIKRTKIKSIAHTLRRDCFSGDVIKRKLEVRIEVTGRRGRKHRQLDDLRDMRGLIIIIIIWIGVQFRSLSPGSTAASVAYCSPRLLNVPTLVARCLSRPQPAVAP